MTVLVYVNTSKQVGDVDHIKVFANAGAAKGYRFSRYPRRFLRI